MAIDIFLKLDDVDGESQHKGHEKWIEVYSWSWGITNPARGRTLVEDLRIVKRTDIASPFLLDGACAGEHFKKAVLVVSKAEEGQEEFYKVTLEDVLITSYQTGGSSVGDAVAAENLSMNFEKIQVEYLEQDPKTGKPQGWVASSCSPRRAWPGPK